ncbi:MAG: ABC transporter permease subunit [Phycisphaerales bacterium]|nr:ABC transporter permease subunit [Phycisphaerales bacterium]
MRKLRDRINESPAMRKFVGNRGAMFASAIISLYLLLFGWILLMQGTAWVGQKTGAFDLRKSPVLGALLPERTLERVGAGNMPGFGLRSNPGKRMEQIGYYFENISKMFDELDEGGSGATEARSEEEIRASVALAERKLADWPVEELRAKFDEAQGVVARQDAMRGLRDALPQMTIAMEKLAGFRAQYESAEPGSESAELASEEVALTLDELMVLIEKYKRNAIENDPVAGFDLAPLEDAMNAAFDGEPMAPIYDSTVVDALGEAVDKAGPVVDAAIYQTVDELDPILSEMYPIPGGLHGLIYKFRMMLGTDQQGRSIMLRALYSAKVAIQVGVVVSLMAVLFGSLIGAAAGYFGGAADHAVIWLYSTFSSIPYLVLLVVLAFMFTGSRFEGTLVPLYAAFSLTYWIGPCRVTRGEALKLRALDYVQAAQALGASRWRILTRHILPNTSHLIFINMSLLFIGAIKGEVVLTYLGLGLKNGASWGIMISQSKQEVAAGFFWQIGAATFFMFVLVLAFNVLTDALQDAFDPKHVG